MKRGPVFEMTANRFPTTPAREVMSNVYPIQFRNALTVRVMAAAVAAAACKVAISSPCPFIPDDVSVSRIN